MRRLHVLVLEPFGGGSHASFYEGWQRYSAHQFQVLHLPAVHWKWRSRHAGLTFALRLEEANLESPPDIVFCSDMLNLAEWKGIADSRYASLPAIAYFHENQFTYPLSAGEKRDYHLAYNNVLTAICANQIWFNSEFHRNEFADAAQAWLRKMPDFSHGEHFDQAIQKSRICYPGINPVPTTQASLKPRHPVIGWVARWEHDKRPDVFLQALTELRRQGQDFQLCLLGQAFQNQHPAYDRIQQEFANQIIHCGYASSPEEYWQRLSDIDIVVSTADHEFFGIGILEAVAAGAIPVVPNRLAYPEVFANFGANIVATCTYDSVDDLVNTLARWIAQHPDKPIDTIPLQEIAVRQFHWQQQAREYDQLLVEVEEAVR
ncbi:MAG: DUF3524 domain-containing protein [Planctomycetales bacterium]|nr:DUF3524 domain-containing protein [Planctomycetales bacterium]